jgi:hypothetical protein
MQRGDALDPRFRGGDVGAYVFAYVSTLPVLNRAADALARRVAAIMTSM